MVFSVKEKGKLKHLVKDETSNVTAETSTTEVKQQKRKKWKRQRSGKSVALVSTRLRVSQAFLCCLLAAFHQKLVRFLNISDGAHQ